MLITILVGAGASFGAFDEGPSRPPLGNQLYDRLVATYPGSWGELPKWIQDEFQGDFGFEAGMVALRQEALSTHQALLDMSCYFGSFQLPTRGRNLYRNLIFALDSLGPKFQYSFGSLNYECLLELSMANLGHPPYYWGNSMASGPRAVLVVKPHGSCNFVPDTGSNTIQVGHFVGGNAYIDTPHLKSIGLTPGYWNSSIPAAMSLYAPGKPNLVAPTAVKRLHNDWRRVIDRSDAILIIGARIIAEGDPHIWRPIFQSSAPIGFIGGVDAMSEYSLGVRLTIIGSRWESCEPELHTWLQQTVPQ
ncbi:MAG TPA: hypothetical protein VFW71_09480 [Actinomycetota bacterium]|nr:hypothetical protein [Actinomycetota bacterium]